MAHLAKRNRWGARPTVPAATLFTAMNREERHQLEDDGLRLALRRLARDWPACCRSWLVGRVVGNLSGSIVRDPVDGRPLCPRCARRASGSQRRLAA